METDYDTLKSVFDALDTENNGYISVDQFLSSFESFRNQKELSDSFNEDAIITFRSKAKQIEQLMRDLDPQSVGQISYDDFIKAIPKLLEIQGGSIDTNSSESVEDFNDKDNLPFKLSQETLVEGTVVTSENISRKSSQFIKDGDSYSNEADSGILSTAWSDCIGNLDQVINDNDSEQGDHKSISCQRHELDLSSGATPSPLHVSDEFQSVGPLFYLASSQSYAGPYPTQSQMPPHVSISGTSQSVKRAEVRGTWPRRRQSLGASSHWHQPSVQRQARDLFASSVTGSPLSGSRSDVLYDDLDSNFFCLQDQFNRLEQKLESITSNQSQSESYQDRLRENNQLLTDKVITLEEQQRELEIKSNQALQMEQNGLKQRMARLDRDKQQEIETLRNRLHVLESQGATSRYDVERYKSEAERYQLEKLKAEEKLSDVEYRHQTLQEEMSRAAATFKSDMSSLRKERDHATEVLQELHREVEDLRIRAGGSGEGTGSGWRSGERGLSSAELLSRYREVQELVQRLTTENKALREQLEESQAELLTRSLEEGRSLIRSSELSLASELDNYSKDELMDLLVKEKDANFKLRDYTEKIIIRVMDRHPSILEISSNVDYE